MTNALMDLLTRSTAVPIGAGLVVIGLVATVIGSVRHASFSKDGTIDTSAMARRVRKTLQWGGIGMGVAGTALALVGWLGTCDRPIRFHAFLTPPINYAELGGRGIASSTSPSYVDLDPWAQTIRPRDAEVMQAWWTLHSGFQNAQWWDTIEVSPAAAGVVKLGHRMRENNTGAIVLRVVVAYRSAD